MGGQSAGDGSESLFAVNSAHPRHRDDELVAAVAGHHVGGPQCPAERVGHGAEDRITGGVAICAVDSLETVDDVSTKPP